MGVRFLVDALRRICEIIIEGVDACLKDSFEEEEMSSEGETEEVADLAEACGEFKNEDVAGAVLHRVHEPCSTYPVNAHKSSLGGYYAVRRGYRPGVYLSWPDCRVQVEGFSGAEHKRFRTYQEAQQYVVAAASKIYSKASLSSSRENSFQG